MNKRSDQWRGWPTRFKSHLREFKQKHADISKKLEISEGALRHWLNGTRKINLEDFFRLCDAANADPVLILFGPMPSMTEDMKRRLGDAVVKVIESDTLANPHYQDFIGAIRKDFKRRNPTSK